MSQYAQSSPDGFMPPSQCCSILWKLWSWVSRKYLSSNAVKISKELLLKKNKISLDNEAQLLSLDRGSHLGLVVSVFNCGLIGGSNLPRD